MYFASSRATTKKSQKGSIANMLRKNRKRNHIKCSNCKTEKSLKGKNRERNHTGNKQKTVTNMVDMSPTISIIAFYVHDRNITLKI